MKIKLSDTGKIITGNTPKTSDENNYSSKDIPFVKPCDIDENEIIRIDNTEYWLSDYARSSARIIPANSVLVTCIGIIGKVAIAAKECAFNQQINAIVPYENKFLPEYISYAVLAKQKQLQEIANAPVVPIINKTQFSNIEIIERKIEEQRIIVNKLKKLSEIILNKKQQIEKLDTLVKSRFVEMFGDPYLNNKNWDIDNLGKYMTVLTDFSANGSYELLDSHVTMYDEPNYAVMVRTADLESGDFKDDLKYIDKEAYELLSKSKLYGGELIMNKIGSAGNIYIMPVLDYPASLGRNAFMFRFDERICITFLYYLLSSEYGKKEIQQHVRGAVTKTITKDSTRKIRVIVPPIELQTQFANFVEQVEKQKETVKKSLEKLETLKKSLMQEYFG